MWRICIYNTVDITGYFSRSKLYFFVHLQVVWYIDSRIQVVWYIDSRIQVVWYIDSRIQDVWYIDSGIQVVWYIDSRIQVVWYIDSRIQVVWYIDSRIQVIWLSGRCFICNAFWSYLIIAISERFSIPYRSEYIKIIIRASKSMTGSDVRNKQSDCGKTHTMNG